MELREYKQLYLTKTWNKRDKISKDRFYSALYKRGNGIERVFGWPRRYGGAINVTIVRSRPCRMGSTMNRSGSEVRFRECIGKG